MFSLDKQQLMGWEGIQLTSLEKAVNISKGSDIILKVQVDSAKE